MDFDGVAHPVSAIKDWRSLNVHGSDLAHLIEKRNLFRWLPVLEAALEEHPDVLLVVHSSWRSVADNTRMKAILGASLASRFIGVTSPELNRYQGIMDFAKRSEMDHFLVLDDAMQDFPADFKHLIATDPELGLSEADIGDRLNDWLQNTSPSPSALMTASMTG